MPRNDSYEPGAPPARVRKRNADTRKAAGPDVSKMPGTMASDYTWDPESGNWAFNGQSRPGFVYAGSPDLTKDGRTGWVDANDWKNTNGLFRGWTKSQLMALAGIGGAALAGPAVSAFGGGGGAAGGAAGAASGAAATVPDIAVTSGLPAGIGTSVGLGGAGAAGAAGVLGSSSYAGAVPTIAANSAGNMAGYGAGTAGTVASTGSSMGSTLSTMAKLKAAGIDPTTLGLGIASMMVGRNTGYQPTDYSKASPEARRLVDPIQAMYNAMNALNNLGVSQSNMLRNGITLKNSTVAAPPSPVTVPGLPFQIGGGLATDPALLDPSLLTLSTGGDVFGSMLGDRGTNMPTGYSPVPRKKLPNAGS